MHQLLQIDDLVIGDHYYLSSADQCFYYMEYTAKGGYSASPANNLILNFKKALQYKGQPSWKYKAHAIREVAKILEGTLEPFLGAETCTLVPMPPSKIKGNPLHDDRMLQALNLFGKQKNADVRELILLNEDMEAVHGNDRRPPPYELLTNMRIDDTLSENLGENIILFDDVITTGSHYVACRDLIYRNFPGKFVCGVFIARRSLPPVADAFADFSEE